MAAVTLSSVMKTEVEPLRKGVIMNLLRAMPILGQLPFENVGSLTSIAVRWTKLPTSAFRRINEAYTTSEGDVEQVQESVYGFGGEIQLDRVYDKITNTIVDPKRLQTEMRLKSMALTFGDYFINGDHATDEDGFEGLKKRVSNLPTRQLIDLSLTTDSFNPLAAASDARHFIDKLDEAHYKCNGGQVGAILVNEGVRWGLGRALRLIAGSGGNFLDVTRDTFDREILTYKGAPVLDMGLKVDQSTEIIGVAETAGTSSDASDGTSIYFVSFGGDQGLSGIQLGPMEVYDPLGGAEMPTTPAKLLRVDWWVGLAMFGSYGIVRVMGLKNPASW